MNETTSKNIRELDSVFKFYTVVTLLGAMTFVSSIAVSNWIAAGISGAITVIGTFVAYRTEVEIEAQKVITRALSDARDVKVAALYGKETPDE